MTKRQEDEEEALKGNMQKNFSTGTRKRQSNLIIIIVRLKWLSFELKRNHQSNKLPVRTVERISKQTVRKKYVLVAKKISHQS